MPGKILNFLSVAPTLDGITYDLTQGDPFHFYQPSGSPPTYIQPGFTSFAFGSANKGFIPSYFVPGGDDGMPYPYLRLNNDPSGNGSSPYGAGSDLVGFDLPVVQPSSDSYTMSLATDFRFYQNAGDADMLGLYLLDTSYHGNSGPMNNTTYNWFDATGGNYSHGYSTASCVPASITVALQTYYAPGIFVYYKDKNNNVVTLLATAVPSSLFPFSILDGSSHRFLANFVISGTTLTTYISVIRYVYGTQANTNSITNNYWNKVTPTVYTAYNVVTNSAISAFSPRLMVGGWSGSGYWDTKDISNVSFSVNKQLNTSKTRFLTNKKTSTYGTSSTKIISNNSSRIPSNTLITLQAIAAGGGGGGGAGVGGGGGAGGFIRKIYSGLKPGQVIPIAVGAGGASGTGTGSTGGTTRVFDLSAFGGGGGGSTQGPTISGLAGSSGGGAGPGLYTIGQNFYVYQGGSAIPYLNYEYQVGGNGGQGAFGNPQSGGGGGGWYGPGGSGTTSRGGAGGNAYPFLQDLYNEFNFDGLGGGGGGGGSYNGNLAADGGSSQGGGGGGGGVNISIPLFGSTAVITPYGAGNGIQNTSGGGGGGAGYTGYTTGGNGGSGFACIIVPTVQYSGVYTGTPTISQSSDGVYTMLLFRSLGSYTT